MFRSPGLAAFQLCEEERPTVAHGTRRRDEHGLLGCIGRSRHHSMWRLEPEAGSLQRGLEPSRATVLDSRYSRAVQMQFSSQTI